MTMMMLRHLCRLVVVTMFMLSAHWQDQVQRAACSLYGEAHMLEAVGELVESSGLSWNYYDQSCPSVESVVADTLNGFLDADITQAAGLLRLHAHDCSVQGCDASLLLFGNANETEQASLHNMYFRPEAFNITNTIKQKLEEICPNTVSCADILALAARDSVVRANGGWYPVALGRKDSLEFANVSVVDQYLPSPYSNVSQLLATFTSLGMDVVDLVALSGAHTIGSAHCPAFADKGRLELEDNTNLDPSYAAYLRTFCPTANSTNFTNLDVITPNLFDNQYYAAIASNKALLYSDAMLSLDSRTNDIVASFASDQRLFFWQFGVSMIKMGSSKVLTGSEGEVRSSCANSNTSPSDKSLLRASS